MNQNFTIFDFDIDVF